MRLEESSWEKITQSIESEACGIIGGIQMIWAVKEAGYEPHWIKCIRGKERDLIEKMCPSVPLLEDKGIRKGEGDQVPIVFGDSSLSEDNPIWKRQSLNWVVIIRTSDSRLAKPKGWEFAKIGIPHSEVNGVSDAVRLGAIYGRKNHWAKNNEPLLDKSIKRDVYSVVEDHKISGRSAYPPKVVTLEEPTVMTIGKASNPDSLVYHGGGLFPWGAPRTIRLLLPSSLTKTKWCVRRLSLEEYLYVGDVPTRFVQTMKTQEKVWLSKTLEPGRCYSMGIKSLIRSQGLADEEGRVVRDRVWTSSEKCLNNGFNHEEVERDFGYKQFQNPDGTDESQLGGIENDAVHSAEMKEDSLSDVRKKEERERRIHQAVKSDDAEVPIFVWNERCRSGFRTLTWTANQKDCYDDRIGSPIEDEKMWDRALEGLRELGLCWWKKNLRRSFSSWLKDQDPEEMKGETFVSWANSDVELCSREKKYAWTENGRMVYQKWWRMRKRANKVSWESGVVALEYGMATSWWNWDCGSAPFFWRWPAFYLESVRDGLDIWKKEGIAKLRNRKRQRSEKDEDIRRRMRKKLGKVRNRGYIQGGVVESLTSFFAVPKGKEDIRMVYDGTASGLNDLIWVPGFPLPRTETHLRALDSGYYMADIDIGEMFLNFVLHESMRQLAGVDLTLLFEEEAKGKTLWERWCRCAMGLKSSPYQAIQAVLVAEEVIKGDRTSSENVFHWSDIRLNIPGSDDYDPTKPWVSKIRLDGWIAADMFIYVDDARTTGATYEQCWKAARRTASVLNWLGIQDAARKRREPSREPGAWAGSIFKTENDRVTVKLSEEKWDKTKRIIEELREYKINDQEVSLKALSSHRGFLQYVVRTYPQLKPFMKGFHNSVDQWRQGRDKEGWKIPGWKINDDDEGDAELEVEFGIQETKPPKTVKMTARLLDDLEAWHRLTRADTAPERLVMASKRGEIYYGFGDASKSGFGGVISGRRNKVQYVHGQWCDSMMDESSNFREFTNLVQMVEWQVKSEGVKDCEIFLFTDNSATEAVFRKGNSVSEKLFDLMVCLKEIEMNHRLKLHVIHVSGQRMIEQGGDGLSRADMTQGVMAGRRMEEFIPLNEATFERSPGIIKWVKSWWDDGRGRLEIHKDPKDWFTSCHQPGNHLWMPPPGAADVVAEELGKAIHKRPYNCHIVLVPRLMTNEWKRAMMRRTDICLEAPAGCMEAWPTSMFEPLLIFVYFPLLRQAPWSYKNTPYCTEFGGLMRKMWESSEMQQRNCLRKFLTRSRKVERLSKKLVWEVLSSPKWKPLPSSSVG